MANERVGQRACEDTGTDQCIGFVRTITTVAAMSFVATTLRVMIASPGDTADARDSVERAIHDWNATHAESRSVVLLPWRWETSAIPESGDEPQAILNVQGLDRADIVFALFGSRIGSPTATNISGTVEEVERADSNGKPVHIYFSKAPHPTDVDLDQLGKLRDFKAAVSSTSLYGEYDNVTDLTVQVWKAIEYDLAKMNLDAPRPPGPDAVNDVRFFVQKQQSTETVFSTKGEPRTRTRRWIDVTNQSDTKDAENVTFELETPGDMHMFAPNEPITVHPRQTRQIPFEVGIGGVSGEPILIVNWDLDGERKSKRFNVG